MAEPLTLEWLREKWSDPTGPRPVLRTPMDAGDWIVGTTDGRTAMCLPKVGATDFPPLPSDVVASWIAEDTANAISVSLAELREWAGTWIDPDSVEPVEVKCPECHGTGEVFCTCSECDYEHTADCGECDGSGEVLEDDDPPPVYSRVFGTLVNRINVARVLADLTWDEPVRVLVREGSAPITIDGMGWRALVMPLLDIGRMATDGIPTFPPREATNVA